MGRKKRMKSRYIPEKIYARRQQIHISKTDT